MTLRRLAAAVAACGPLAAAEPALAEPASFSDEQNTGYWTTAMDAECVARARARLAAGDAELAPALQALRREADACMPQGPFTVMDKTAVPPSGDKHDYLSFGPYWWPDPAKKDGLPYVRRDGEVNPQSVGSGSDRVALERMASAVETLALAGYLSGERTYAARAGRLLAAWFLDPATAMHPHLTYGQAIPGICEGRGIGIIETRRFLQVVNAVGLLEGTDALTAGQHTALRTWFRDYLQWLLESAPGKAESRERNNHGTWYDAQVACLARFTGRRELAARVLEEARKSRLMAQVSPVGQQRLELARTRAFTYSLINLSGLLALAELGRQEGVDYWSVPSAGQSLLRQAVDYVGVCSDPQKPWPHAQITELNRLYLCPALCQAALRTRDPKYLALLAQLPKEATASGRARLLWPGDAGAGP